MTLPLLPLAAALFLQPSPPEPPRAVVRQAVRAVEGDSAAALEVRWAARLQRDSRDHAARLGLATLARLRYDYVAAQRHYARMASLDSDSEHPLSGAGGYWSYAMLGRAASALTRGQYGPAFTWYRGAVAHAERRADATAAVEAQLGLATLHLLEGAPDSAAVYLQRVPALLARAAPEQRGEYACLRAAVLGRLGRPGAETAAEEGVRAARRAADRRVEARCRFTLALIHFGRGDLAAAAPHLLAATELQRATRDRAGLAVTLQWYGHMLVSVASFAAARERLQEALVEADASGSRAVRAWALVSRAQVARFTGEARAAAAYADEAAEFFGAQQSPPGLAVSQELQVELALAAGDLPKAQQGVEALHRRLLRNPRAPPLERFADHVRLARLAAHRGDAAAGRRELQAARALALANGLGGWASGLWRGEVMLALLAGDGDAAERALLAGWDMPEQPPRVYERLARRAEIEARRGRLDSAAFWLVAANSRVDEWRASLTDPQLRLAALQVDNGYGDADLGVATVLARLALGGRLDDAFRLAEQQRARELQDRLLQAGTRRALARTPEGWTTRAALQQALPDERTALLVFVTGRGGEPSTLFVVTRTVARAYLLPPLDSLAGPIARFSALVEDGLESGPLARRLGDALLGRALRELPPAVARLVIVPDDGLHRLPWDALRTPAGSLLLERYATAQVPAAAVALELWRRPPARRSASLLALGDPAFAAEVAPRASAFRSAFDETGGLTRLDGSATEARRVARYAPGAALRLRAGASEAFLKRTRLDTLRVLHFATHALVDEQEAGRTALALAPGGGEDGFLGMAELAALRLDADLVVLSACRTAGGAVLKGEGVQGLVTPLLAAGARSVAATRWSVDDRRTARFVDDFYAALARGLPAADALRAARLRALRRGAPAREWAAFTLVGDPLVRVPLRPPRSPWPARGAGAGAVLVAAAALVYGARRRKLWKPERSSEPSASRARTHHW